MLSSSGWRRTALVCAAAGGASAVAAYYLRRRRQRRDALADAKAFEASFRTGPAWAYLRVAASTVAGAGEGLFAERAFAAGETLGHYRGQRLSLAKALKLDDRDYLMGGFGVNVHVDAREAYAMPGRYVNDNFDAAARNAEFRKNRATASAALVATRAIAAGEEVFAAYGASYWRARGIDPATGAPLADKGLAVPPGPPGRRVKF